MDTISLLQSSDIFRGVDAPRLHELVQDLATVRYPAGRAVFQRGDHGDAVYIVADGEIGLEIDGWTVLELRSGACFGEFALIDEEPRSAGAVAVTDSVLLRWEREDFQRAMANDVVLAQCVFRMLTWKLRESVENAVRKQVEQHRIQQDLQRAREIQAGMLPHRDLSLPNLNVSGLCKPATAVGGDFYDYFPNGAETSIAIGDVTGHGFHSGLFVAMAKSALHARAERVLSPSQTLVRLRHTLELSLDRLLLMTCCHVSLEPESGRLRYANAGHPPAMLWRSSSASVELLPALDPLLGALPASTGFSEHEIGLSKGDVLLLYSDGVTEARSPSGEFFGEARLQALFAELAPACAAAIKDGVSAALESHTAHAVPSDDITLVVAATH
ncbi:MAG: PP2C family protein-serine/threonine phosphatase [Gammaproteobacteria bacterium]